MGHRSAYGSTYIGGVGNDDLPAIDIDVVAAFGNGFAVGKLHGRG